MVSVNFRCYGELNDYLPRSFRQKTLLLKTKSIFIADLIDSLHIPYSQVSLLLANGQPVDFLYAIKEDDRITVYPAFHTIELESIH